jgi:hypothetical protein
MKPLPKRIKTDDKEKPLRKFFLSLDRMNKKGKKIIY